MVPEPSVSKRSKASLQTEESEKREREYVSTAQNSQLDMILTVVCVNKTQILRETGSEKYCAAVLPINYQPDLLPLLLCKPFWTILSFLIAAGGGDCLSVSLGGEASGLQDQ